MEQMQNKDVPFNAFEGEMVRAEIRDKRKDRIIALLAIIVLISNMAWLWFFSQFDITDSTVTVDSTSAGNANYIGQDGDITNGEP
jgi:hypothetical protein